jgi:hypothetical protein
MDMDRTLLIAFSARQNQKIKNKNSKNSNNKQHMKKIAILLAIGGFTATNLFGQGAVNFSNSSGSQNVSTNNINGINQDGTAYGATGIAGATSGLVATSTTAPNGYFYALLMQAYSGSGPTVTASLSGLLSENWTYTGLTGVNGLGAGRISGGNPATTTAGDTLGAANQFIVVAWSAVEGNTWAAFSTALQNQALVVGGYVGLTTVGTGVGSTSPVETLFGGGTGIQGPTTMNIVVPTPEPSTMALAALGGASLLLFRRRK